MRKNGFSGVRVEKCDPFEVEALRLGFTPQPTGTIFSSVRFLTMVNIVSWVANVNRTRAIYELPTEFKHFLSAPVFQDSNGMSVSMLSALARMNVDPWQEADELSNMPVGDATQRLTSLIVSLPNRPSTSPDAVTMARRLINMLPRSPVSNLSAHSRVFGSTATIKSQPAILYVVYVVIMTLAMAVQVVLASRQEPPQVEHSSTQGSSDRPVSPEEQPMKSGQ